MNRLFTLALLAIPMTMPAAEQSPYAGQELRDIRSLSAEEIESLRRGDGMGYAKLAELNHYPGPRHVLAIADELALSAAQLDATQALFEEMRHDAVKIGAELVAAESRLDRQFRDKMINQESLEAALLDIGEIRARLRYVHLEAHLRQRELLDPEQIARYDELRGYRDSAHRHGH